MGYRIRPLAAALAVAFLSPAAWALTTLNEVVVTDRRIQGAAEGTELKPGQIAPMRASTSDSVSLLQDVPGVSLYGAGGVSSLPVIHGLADDRLRISVDGMDFISSCPNHMNPPLSYLDPSSIGKLTVYAGIAPVSVGGESIGGSIVAETAAPEFATPGQGLLTKGEVGAFYRSNNNAQGGNLGATLATENFSISYTGATAKADNYMAGGDFKKTTATGRNGHTLALDEVGSTAYESWSHLLGIAFKSGNHLFEAKAGYQDVPQQLYPNQRMDMLGNEQSRFNFRYLGQYDWGLLEARAYYEKVDHYMNFGDDKQLVYGTAVNGMPMYSRGETSGVTLKADIDLGANNLLRIGGLYQHYTLNDWWPASGTGGMAPYTFQNINNGQRDRTGLFGEWEAHPNAQWTTLIGARYEYVTTSADTVHGYNLASAPTAGSGGMMNQTTDAVRFNHMDRSQGNGNVDLSALARYNANANSDIEFGLARKVRSPNLYERYTWSTAGMMAIMNNFVGDGNGYIGNPDLKPEKAYTASATFDWHGIDRSWELKATPYFTYVEDYIDAVRCKTGASCTAANSSTSNQFVVLQYANQSARLYGLDLSGRMPLAKTAIGNFGLKGLLNYTKGENRDTGDDLYNIMPLNAKLALTQQTSGWDNAIEVVGVMGKHAVSDVRNEVQTSGYSLTHLRGSYTWNKLRVDFGVENLFDKFYYLPTGGAYSGQGTTMSINGIPWGIAVPGMGRSFYAGLNLKF
jgi:iron complex outermembrane recepter protein